MATLQRICGLFFICILLPICTARIHKLSVRNDDRRYITVSTFGFYKQGILSVRMTNFRHSPYNENNHFGFSLDRTRTDAMSPYLDTHQERCLLEYTDRPPNESPNSTPVMLFRMNLREKSVSLTCNEPEHKCPICLEDSLIGTCTQTIILKEEIKDNVHYFSLNFTIKVPSEAQEGLYNLYFYNCPRYNRSDTKIDFDMEIREENSNNNYLSAGQMPLPALYFMMALLCFLSGCFWVFILRHSKHPVFKIHYLMAVLVFLKSLSLLFHAMNYHFIQTKGEHVPTWAILYYVTHLLKGAVLFITIVLVGTGWNFIKHILSEKDKKIFMIVIPLQVLANVAEIIIEESEEGDIEHRTWREIFILVDLLCCGSILFPVVWSIRHLQEASHTDGKAAINLRKLKLFRHFYLMIVSYIYFTRIIVFLLKFTVPFQYEWLDEMFREMTTYVFFVLTGYRFRPAAANPYFQLSTEEEDMEDMDSVVTESGVTEGLTKMSRGNTGAGSSETADEDRVNLLSKRESSHEYD